MEVSTKGYGNKKIWESTTIQTNDPNRPWIELVVTGQVEKFAELIPDRVRMRGPAGQPLSAEVEIVHNKKYPFRVKQLQAKDGRYFRYKLREISREEKGRSMILIENLRTEKGRYFDSLYIETDSVVQPVITLFVTGIIE